MSRDTMGNRILYQSFGPRSNEVYVKALSRMLSHGGELIGMDVDVATTERGRFEGKQFRAFHTRAVEEVIATAYRAAESGYGAVVIGNAQDPGLLEARQVASIPVLGLLESAILGVQPFGARIGLVASGRLAVPTIRERIRVYGLESRVCEITRTDLKLSDWAAALTDSGDVRSHVERAFALAVEELADAGADVVVPCSGIVAAFLSCAWGVQAGWCARADQPPVVNPVITALTSAAAALRCHRNGLQISRLGAYVRPPDHALEEYFHGA